MQKNDYPSCRFGKCNMDQTINTSLLLSAGTTRHFTFSYYRKTESFQVINLGKKSVQKELSVTQQ